MQYGTKQVPFGLDRLKVIEWIHSLITLKEDSICNKIAELELPKLFLDLIKAYDMNSFLHLKIFNVFSEALQNEIALFVETVNIY
jgi:hypothetical protein